MSTISAGAGPSTTSRGLRPSPEPPTSLRSTRPRYGEKAAYGFLVVAAGVSILTTVGIVLSLLIPALQFFREVSVCRVPHRDLVDAAVPAEELRRAPAHHRNAVDDGHRAVGGDPDRARRGHLPVGVRLDAHPQDLQAHARAAGRCAVGGLRPLRRGLRRPGRAQRVARHRGRHVLRALRRARPRRDDHSHGRVAVGGRDVRGAEVAARGVLRPGCEPDAHGAAGRLPGRHLGHRRRDRARPEPGGRRDDDRRHGRRQPGQDGHQPAGGRSDDDRLHRLRRPRRQRAGLAGLLHALRGGPDPVRHHADHQPDQHPPRQPIP